MASSTETGVKLLSPVVETHSNRWDAGSVFRPVLAWGILGFVTFVVEVLLLSGLRGSASGISALIDSLTVLGAVLTQLLFVSGVILVVHLELLLIRSTAPWPLRALSVPVTSVLCTLLMNAAVGELAVLPLLLLGILATGLALATGIARGLARNDLAAKGGVLLDHLEHRLLDAGEVFVGERGVGLVEVVIKAVFDRRPDGHLRPGEEPLDGVGHDVRRRMADHREPIRIRLADGLELGARVDRGHQIDDTSILRPDGNDIVLEAPFAGKHVARQNASLGMDHAGLAKTG